jgi:hypothetical protein
MNRKSIYIVLAVLALVVATLACGESTPEVRVPEATPKPGETQPAAPPAATATERPAPTPTTAPLGSSRSNPAPVGAEVTINDMTMKIIEVTRPADDIVAAGNMFNATPEPGNEYIMVTISVVCNKSSDVTCQLNSYLDFKLTGSSGSVRDPEIIVGVAGLLGDPLEDTEFFGGATVTGGTSIFEVAQDETDLILIYEPLFGTSKAYLAVQ